MSVTVKLFFDECLSSKLLGIIKAVYEDEYPQLEIVHLTDFFKKGDDDRDWLSLLKEDKEWVVITSDQGNDPKKEKLNVLCRELGVSHVYMTASMLDAGYPAHKHAILTLWPQIVRIPLLPKGTRISLGKHTLRGGTIEWPRLAIDNKPFDVVFAEKVPDFNELFSN